MKNDIYDYLIFKLDAEHYDYEFQLISIPPYEIIENNISLESYEYFGDINQILGLRVQHIFLYFNADRLMRVELIYRGNKLYYLKKIIEDLKDVTLTSIMFLKMYYLEESNKTIIMYQSRVLTK